MSAAAVLAEVFYALCAGAVLVVGAVSVVAALTRDYTQPSRPVPEEFHAVMRTLGAALGAACLLVGLRLLAIILIALGWFS